jgi:hypothetical protein
MAILEGQIDWPKVATTQTKELTDQAPLITGPLEPIDWSLTGTQTKELTDQAPFDHGAARLAGRVVRTNKNRKFDFCVAGVT